MTYKPFATSEEIREFLELLAKAKHPVSSKIAALLNAELNRRSKLGRKAIYDDEVHVQKREAMRRYRQGKEAKQ